MKNTKIYTTYEIINSKQLSPDWAESYSMDRQKRENIKWIRIDQLKELTHDDIIELIQDE